MKVIRLDALHDTDADVPSGEFTRFYRDECEAQAASASLQTMGWLCDWYAVEFPLDPLDRDRTITRLVSGIWPNIQLEQLLIFADSPSAALLHKHHRRRRSAA